MEKGNPIPEAPAAPEPSKELYNYPPCTSNPVMVQSQNTGDIWLGFNPALMGKGVALAWVGLKIEKLYEDNAEALREARALALNPKPKVSKIVEILTRAFRRK